MRLTKRARSFNHGNKTSSSMIGLMLVGFFVGCLTTATILVNFSFVSFASSRETHIIPPIPTNQQQLKIQSPSNEIVVKGESSSWKNDLVNPPLKNVRILVAIAAFDFSQIPHLEEVIDTYQDLCVTGAKKVDIVIHSSVPYPVTLIDLYNSRITPACENVLSIQIILVPPSVRLHLVDFHRPYFYEHIEEYDLFIYTEDDIRVSPRTVAAYLYETAKVRALVGNEKFSDFNVGIVRYEYNYPSNVIIDDKTRHATQNVTRVYWEHGQFPIMPKAVDVIPPQRGLPGPYVHMKNHHQGMFLATQELLLAWKNRPQCRFHEVRDRPGLKNRPSQPAEGTQRVWMSSQMLYGGRHCDVQQVLPVDTFGTLTVLHLPNKNYRRVGHFRNRTFSDGTEKFQVISDSLITAMRLHLEFRKHFSGRKPQRPYKGIVMVDKVGKRERSPLLERRMNEYQDYVDRGGVLSDYDMTKTQLIEEE